MTNLPRNKLAKNHSTKITLQKNITEKNITLLYDILNDLKIIEMKSANNIKLISGNGDYFHGSSDKLYNNIKSDCFFYRCSGMEKSANKHEIHLIETEKKKRQMEKEREKMEKDMKSIDEMMNDPQRKDNPTFFPSEEPSSQSTAVTPPPSEVTKPPEMNKYKRRIVETLADKFKLRETKDFECVEFTTGMTQMFVVIEKVYELVISNDNRYILFIGRCDTRNKIFKKIDPTYGNESMVDEHEEFMKKVAPEIAIVDEHGDSLEENSNNQTKDHKNDN